MQRYAGNVIQCIGPSWALSQHLDYFIKTNVASSHNWPLRVYLKMERERDLIERCEHSSQALVSV